MSWQVTWGVERKPAPGLIDYYWCCGNSSPKQHPPSEQVSLTSDADWGHFYDLLHRVTAHTTSYAFLFLGSSSKGSEINHPQDL